MTFNVAELVDAVMERCLGVEILCSCERCRQDAEIVVLTVLDAMKDPRWSMG